MPLTVVEARNAAPGEKDYKLRDEKGLYLLVRPNGTKAWRHKYRFAGREKLASYGLFPEVGLKEARDQRDASRALLRLGKDPMAEAERQRQAAVAAAGAQFKAVGDAWHAAEKPGWSPGNAARVYSALKRDVYPALGKRPVSEIEPTEVLAVLRKIERRGAIETAKRVNGYIYRIFQRAKSEHLIKVNPALDLGDALLPTPKGSKQPALTKLSELRKLIDRVDRSTSGPATKLANRLLALTVVRIGVLRAAEWPEFLGIDWEEPANDAPEPEWYVSAERMKLEVEEKGDTAYDHRAPLVPQAVATLRALRLLTGRCRYPFPNSRTTAKPMTDSAISSLYLELGYRGKHVPHGWRTAFSTIMNEWAAKHGRDHDRLVIDLMLAHKPKGMSSSEFAYNRALFSDRRRELAQVWADMIMEGLDEPMALLKGQVR
ncbi:integrase arm-type DNA-binding domain-containing protein [Sphingomonas cannabina]|uniref:tyrosine-type recombinase/integrase n=1 Tax=Sphingomonas cannabina TaxID=2899123 RepID=UPI001F201D1B|nr:integrase arm-type DNA-binding domain-containing protein [Sphingomonas cannabina]UIJ43692.1 integrase arm-type DNA-binding domain-containing protein [Sphingomonas cannabina]